MISEVKQAIAQKILELYPTVTIYDEDVPQNFKKPSFLITLVEHSYSKRLADKFNSTASFDVVYFSNKDKSEIKSDCQAVQVNLLRVFDLMGTFRAQNLQATIVDNVLHITFDVNYSEIKTGEEIPKMEAQTTNTSIKE